MTLNRFVRWGVVFTGVAIVMFGVHRLWLRVSSTSPSGPAGQLSGQTRPGTASDQTTSTLPQREFDKPEKLSLDELSRKIEDARTKVEEMGIQLARTKFEKSRSDAAAIQLGKDIEKNTKELKDAWEAVPGFVESRNRCDSLTAARRKQAEEMRRLEGHLEQHGKSADGKPARPYIHCPYCQADFEKFAAGDPEVIQGLESRLKDLMRESASTQAELQKAMAEQSRLVVEARRQPSIQSIGDRLSADRSAIEKRLNEIPEVVETAKEYSRLQAELQRLIFMRSEIFKKAKVVEKEVVPKGAAANIGQD